MPETRSPTFWSWWELFLKLSRGFLHCLTNPGNVEELRWHRPCWCPKLKSLHRRSLPVPLKNRTSGCLWPSKGVCVLLRVCFGKRTWGREVKKLWVKSKWGKEMLAVTEGSQAAVCWGKHTASVNEGVGLGGESFCQLTGRGILGSCRTDQLSPSPPLSSVSVGIQCLATVFRPLGFLHFIFFESGIKIDFVFFC